MTAIIILCAEFILFAIAVYLLFYLPGKVALHLGRIKTTYPSNYFLSTSIGMILFTLTYYSLSWISLQIAIYPIILIVLYYAKKNNLLKLSMIPSDHKKASLLIFTMAIIFSFTMIFNGNFGNTIYFFGDDMAHLGYIAELRNAFPPQHPGFAGIPLKGYHFFSDYLVAIFSNTTSISHMSIYFHFMPILVAFGWAYGTYSLLFSWTRKIATSLWGVFFMLFGSSFSFILLLINYPNANLFSNFGIDQPVTALLNAPFALSFVFVLSALLCFHIYLATSSRGILVMLGLIVGIASMFKVYAGILIIGAFCIFVLTQLLRKRWEVLISAIISLGIFASTFVTFAGKGAHLFYLPLWPIERMFDGIFPEYNYKEKIATYSQHGVIRGLIETHLYTFFIFLVGNIGTRFIGIVALCLFLKEKKKPSLFSLILLSMTIISVMIPLLFAQSIKVFDMIQMTWYFPLLVSLPAALGIEKLIGLLSSKKLKLLTALLIVLFTIPLSATYLLTRSFPLLTTQRNSFTNDYHKAMTFLKENGSYSDTVLELPLGIKYQEVENVKIWFETSSTHIPAFGNKRMYIGNQYIVFPNMPILERLQFITNLNQVEQIENPHKSTIQAAVHAIKNENIKYIYSLEKLRNLTASGGIQPVFNQGIYWIYKVD